MSTESGSRFVIQPTSGVPQIGTTVTLRVTTPVGPISVVGELVAVDNGRWSIRRRDGAVTLVDTASIEAQRVVPPPKSQLASVVEVEQAAVLGWRALETATLGDWLLRASGGFTSRANSVLTLGDPGLPLAEALAVVRDWYDGRGVSTQLQVIEGGSDPGLAGELAGRGWQVSPRVHVMTGEISHALRALPPEHTAAARDVQLADAPDDAWIGCYARVGNDASGVAQQQLRNHPAAVFASIRDGDDVLAIARAAVDAKWAGLFAVEVMADHRRRGLGAVVSAAALREAARRGARRCYLQCSVDNTPAVALYSRLNFRVHHDYEYYSPAAR